MPEIAVQLEIRYLPLSTLTGYFLERNGKLHDLEAIAASIRRYGFRDPLAIDAALNEGRGGIVEGNGRLEALQWLQANGEAAPRWVVEVEGDWCVPVVVGGDSGTESEGLAYAIDHNLSTLLGSGLGLSDMVALYDRETLLTTLDDLALLPLTISEDDLPDLRLEPELQPVDEDCDLGAMGDSRSALGEVWQLGRHFLICGDSCDPQTLSRLQQAADVGSVDLLLTDPPYNVGYTGKTDEALTIENDSMESAQFEEFLIAAFTNADRLLRPGGVFYIWHADTMGSPFRRACTEAGWQLRQCLIWVKQSFVMGRQDYHWQHEPCLYGWKDGAGHLWNGDRSQSTVLEFDRPTRNAEHPTMKPVELLAYQIANSTRPGGVVLDPFLGSGSTLIACEERDRTCIGVELSPQYCDVILSRWEAFTGETAVRLA